MFKRLGNLIRGFFGMFVSGLEKQNPEALLEVEKENLRKQIAQYNQGLASHAGLCEKLMAQVRRLEKEADELRTRTAANLKAGNRQLAGQQAVRLKAVQTELNDNVAQLGDAEKAYKELTKTRDVAIKSAQERMQEIARGIDEVKMHKAMADLKEMAAGLVTSVGGSGDTLNRLESLIEEERSKAAGRARVASDSLQTSGAQAQADEESALEEMALADFAAAEGITLEPAQGSKQSAEPTSTEQGKVMIDPPSEQEKA